MLLSCLYAWQLKIYQIYFLFYFFVSNYLKWIIAWPNKTIMSSLYPHCFWRGHRAVKVWFIAEANHVDESLNMEQHGRVKIERKFSVLNKIKQRIRPAVHLMQQRSSSLQRRKQGRKSEKMNLLHTGPLTCCLLSNNVVLRMWKWRCDEWGWPGMMCPWAELMHAQAEFDNSRTPTHFQCCNVGAWRASCDSKLIKSRCIKQTSFQPFSEQTIFLISVSQCSSVAVRDCGVTLHSLHS